MNRLSRTLSASVVGLLVSGVVGATLAPSATADDDHTLTVVGTSDVFDSNLVQTVLKPGFEAANPGVTLNYVSKGTGAAIDYAKAGTASALLVHAAALENQFVADGYSLEPYGRAIFWGDYVLVGPASDPAGVMSGGAATDDITTAFQKVAAAGAAGKADFVSRGGTPGTTVQEHAIWQTTSGVSTCTVPDASGGGTSPYNGTGEGCAVAGTYPSWYHATGLTQGPNITNGATCNYDNASTSGGNDCYVFTDRGTFQYLQSTGQAQNLQIVTRATSATPAAEANRLVNSFHAYAINPKKFDASTAAGINTTLATKFLDYVTSPTGQAAVGAYLGGGEQPDPPFLPSAAPRITAGALPASQDGVKTLTIKGGVTNVVPGTPDLSGVTVQLLTTDAADPDATPVVRKTVTTNATGGYTVSITPGRSLSYTIKVPAITKIERPDLSPKFGDLLQATQKAIGTVKVVGVPKVTKSTFKGSSAELRGTLTPAAVGTTGRVALYVGTKYNAVTLLKASSVPADATAFDKVYTLPAGTKYYQIQYYDADGNIERGSTPITFIRR